MQSVTPRSALNQHSAVIHLSRTSHSPLIYILVSSCLHLTHLSPLIHLALTFISQSPLKAAFQIVISHPLLTCISWNLTHLCFTQPSHLTHISVDSNSACTFLTTPESPHSPSLFTRRLIHCFYHSPTSFAHTQHRSHASCSPVALPVFSSDSLHSPHLFSHRAPTFCIFGAIQIIICHTKTWKP